MVFDKILTFFGIQRFSQDITLLDGTIIRIDGAFGDTNVPVSVLTPDGPIPLPDGEYPLGGDFEGSIIVVVGGIITDIIKINEDAEPEPDELSADVSLETEIKLEPTIIVDEPKVEDDPIVVEPNVDEPIVEIETPIVEIEPIEDEPETELSQLFSRLDEVIKRIEKLETNDLNVKEDLTKVKASLEKVDGATPVKKNVSGEQYNNTLLEVKNPLGRILAEKKNKK